MEEKELAALTDEQLVAEAVKNSNEFDQMKQEIKSRQAKVKAELHKRFLVRKVGGLSDEDKRILGIQDHYLKPTGIGSETEVGSV